MPYHLLNPQPILTSLVIANLQLLPIFLVYCWLGRVLAFSCWCNNSDKTHVCQKSNTSHTAISRDWQRSNSFLPCLFPASGRCSWTLAINPFSSFPKLSNAKQVFLTLHLSNLSSFWVKGTGSWVFNKNALPLSYIPSPSSSTFKDPCNYVNLPVQS